MSRDINNAEAVTLLPPEIQKSVCGVAKSAEPLREDQSPEAIRKANLKSLKVKRRQLISDLIELEKEIFELENLDSPEAISPEIRREFIINSLAGSESKLKSRMFTLSQVRELYPNEAILFSSWVTELKTLAADRYITISGDSIILSKKFASIVKTKDN